VKENPPRKTAIIGLIVTIVGVMMIFVPGFAGIGGMEGGYAISFVSLFVAIMGIIVVVIYTWLAKMLDKILRGEGLLAHWTYTPEEWKEYAEREYAEEKTEKIGLFIVVSAFALFFGVLFWVIDPESGIYIFLAMLGLIAIIGFAWRFTAWHYYNQNKKYLGEAYITRDALYLNRRFYAWCILGARLISVTLRNEQDLTLLNFTFTTPTMTGLQDYTARVPIPQGQEETAKTIVQQNPKH
jgi:MFS family permease